MKSLKKTRRIQVIIVAFAAAHRVALLPYGGGTGLVGGQLTAEGAPLLGSALLGMLYAGLL